MSSKLRLNSWLRLQLGFKSWRRLGSQLGSKGELRLEGSKWFSSKRLGFESRYSRYSSWEGRSVWNGSGSEDGYCSSNLLRCG